eukprot:8383843-Ditylum_brightwellii.AAC.1
MNSWDNNAQDLLLPPRIKKSWSRLSEEFDVYNPGKAKVFYNFASKKIKIRCRRNGDSTKASLEKA